MQEHTITETTIRQLVDAFYDKVRSDPELAPVFNATIGETDAQWNPHLQKMYAFWSSIMLTSGRYHGNPLQKHKDMPPFDVALFDRWLQLFAQTAREIHSPELAETYITKSRRIAESLKFGIYYSPDRIPITPRT